MGTITKGRDGYHHPTSVEELQELVVLAGSEGRKLRVRGAGHSVARAIYTDGYAGFGPPPAGAVEVMLDAYRAIGPITAVPGDPDHAEVEVEAGCNLGKNPYDPTGTSTWANSLNACLQREGWALDDLGGISHQTISGFLSTGSSGGSVMYSVDDNIVGFTLIDGTGKLWSLRHDDPDPKARDMFFAAGVSMGLLGVIAKVRLRLRRAFNLFGKQVTAPTATAPVDLFGEGTAARPGLARFLREAPYTRLMWWPQHGFERVQIWEAARMAPTPGFSPHPYEELGRAPQLASLAGSLFYTVIGNLDDIAAVPGKLTSWFSHLEGVIIGDSDVNACQAPTPDRTHTRTFTVNDVLAYLGARLHDALLARGDALSIGAGHTLSLLEALGRQAEMVTHGVVADVLTRLFGMLVSGKLDATVAQLLANWLQKEMPFIIKDVLGLFVSDGTETFWDTWMCGLPMDNQMDDQLWPTWFTELWVPLDKTAEVMQALKRWYDGGGDPVTAYAHTGAFSCELYASRRSPFWMSPAYERDVFRVDVFWFALNGGDPEAFYQHFWEILRPFAFRPHWGKCLPISAGWADYYAREIPRLKDFLALRDKLDPGQIFVTEYWREALGIARV
jgi:D-arabinono-1,4-lactone oxidase/FAD binding domain